MATIYAPVSIYKVRQALGVNSSDLGTLCRSTAINKWARYKPVKYPGFPIRSGVITTMGLDVTPDPAFDALTGLDFTGIGTFTPVDVAGLYGSYISVAYQPPSGGASSPYRLTDFCQYNSSAQPPVSVNWGLRFALDKEMGFAANLRASSGGDSITFADIFSDLSVNHGFAGQRSRFCMAVIGDDGGDPGDPLWYFFSEKIYDGSAGSFSVKTRNVGNFLSLVRPKVGQTFYFVAMLVDDLDDTVYYGSDYESYGMPAATMASLADRFKAVPLGYFCDEGNGQPGYLGQCRAVLEDYSAVSDITYVLTDPLGAMGFGWDNYQGQLVHMLELFFGDVRIQIPSGTFIDSGAQYKLKVQWAGGDYLHPFGAGTGTGSRDTVDFTDTVDNAVYDLTSWIPYSQVQTNGNVIDTQGSALYLVDSGYCQQFGYSQVLQYLYTAIPQAFGAPQYYRINFLLYYRNSSSSPEVLARGWAVEYDRTTQDGWTTE